MKVNTIQKITNILTESGELLSSVILESYVLIPDTHKILKNIKTGETIATKICVSKKSLIKNYIEIDDPEALKEPSGDSL
jgi:hypothetical protein